MTMESGSIKSDKRWSKLDTIEYNPPNRSIRLMKIRQVIIAGVILAGLVAVYLVIVQALLWKPMNGQDQVLAILILLAATLFICFLFAVVVLERPMTLKDGILNLDFPLRRRGKGWNRSVPLSEIVDITIPERTGGFDTILILLSDGTKFLLPQASFRGRGMEIFNQLCEAFGFDYEESSSKMLLRGKYYGFKNAKPKRVNQGTIFFTRRMPRYSEGRRDRITFDEIARLERVDTSYSGESYLVTLKDGMRFLMSTQDADEVGLSQKRQWSEKLVKSSAASNPQRSRESAD